MMRILRFSMAILFVVLITYVVALAVMRGNWSTPGIPQP